MIGKIATSWAGLRAEGSATVYPERVAAFFDQRTAGRPILPVGNRRSYSDVSLCSHGTSISLGRLDRRVGADWTTGVVRVEAGMTLQDLATWSVANGWFPAVVPGTGRVTVGGACAGDIHGKNHVRQGTFGAHVRSLVLHRTDQDRPAMLTPEARLFAPTIGGLGLTGLISEVELQLQAVPSPWLQVQRFRFDGLEEYLALEASSSSWEHRVAWLDLANAGRPVGEFSRANWLDVNLPEPKPIRLGIPWTPPLSAITRSTSLVASTLLRPATKYRETVEHYAQFLHPLDRVSGWNRLWGPGGFRQWQCVVPLEHVWALEKIVAAIQAARLASPLSVLKRFGDAPSPGLLSFPRPGLSLAVDFPNTEASVDRLFPLLDQIVADVGGSLYPAKDARIPPALFWAAFPNLSEFKASRDPGIQSDFSRRYDL